MSVGSDLVSKVLVCDNDESVQIKLKKYFFEKGLLGLTCKSQNIMSLLGKNTDLGAVFLGDEFTTSGGEHRNLVSDIHSSRPELPIFLRTLNEGASLSEELKNKISGVYEIDNLTLLDEAVNRHLFSMFYPVPLIRGIQEISQQALKTFISGVNVECDTPYLVKDQIIYGELLSLIPLESYWCRGFMMLQTTQNEMLDTIKQGHTNLDPVNTSFRDVNELLNEVTNLIWGRIKSQYFKGNESTPDIDNKVQVPIMVNHAEKYISFGSTEPQLCFRYTLENTHKGGKPIMIYQKLVFNLTWNPEEFVQCEEETNDLVDCGELEFF